MREIHDRLLRYGWSPLWRMRLDSLLHWSPPCGVGDYSGVHHAEEIFWSPPRKGASIGGVFQKIFRRMPMVERKKNVIFKRKYNKKGYCGQYTDLRSYSVYFFCFLDQNIHFQKRVPK